MSSDTWNTVVRRFGLWLLVCGVSAAPSFMWAAGGFSRAAMIVGVALFVVMYTAATSTEQFERFHNRPFMRRTLYIGYGLRVLLSLVFPVGMAADVWPGVVSLSLVRGVGLTPETFVGTLATTCVQGSLLNLILFAFMAAVYAIQRAFMKPSEQVQRGFEVLPAQQAQPVIAPSPKL